MFLVIQPGALNRLVWELGPQAAGGARQGPGPVEMGRKSHSLTQPWLVQGSGWTWPPPTLASPWPALSPPALALGSDQGSPENSKPEGNWKIESFPSPRCADGKLSPQGGHCGGTAAADHVVHLFAVLLCFSPTPWVPGPSALGTELP